MMPRKIIGSILRHSSCFALGMLILIATTCQLEVSPPIYRYTALTVGLVPTNMLAPRTILPNVDMTICCYDIYGDGPGTESFEVTGHIGTTFSRDNLAFGTWDITVTARNQAGVAIGTGSGTVTPDDEQPGYAIITVSPYTDHGAIRITVRWEENALLSASITASETRPGGSTAEVTFVPGADGHSLVWEDLESGAGYHVLSFTLKDGIEEITGDMPTIRVISGATTEYTYEYTAHELELHVPKPVLSVPPDAYSTSQELTMSCATLIDHSIKYTNNGTRPSATNGYTYTVPINISSSQTIRAVALVEGRPPSAITIADYIITDTMAVPEFIQPPGLSFDPIDVELWGPTSWKR